jgi:hypothetical protein
VLHDLTGWALDGGHALAGLSVLRVSLEDVYLGLTEGPGRDDPTTPAATPPAAPPPIRPPPPTPSAEAAR